MDTERQDNRTMSEIIAAARASGVQAEKIAEAERWRDETAAKFRASDRKDAAVRTVVAERAETIRMGELALAVEQDLEAVKRRAQAMYDAEVSPYIAKVTNIARQRAEQAERQVAAEPELIAATEADATAWNLPGGAA